MLIRCCDKSTEASSSVPGQPSLPNTFGEPPLMPIQPQVAEILYSRNNFVKKPLEDASGIGETSRLLLYCWENNHFSYAGLSEILWQVKRTIAYILFYRTDFVYQNIAFSFCLGCIRLHLRIATASEPAALHFDVGRFLAKAPHHDCPEEYP